MRLLLPVILALLLAGCQRTDTGGIRFGAPPTPTAAPKPAAAAPSAASAAASATTQPSPTVANVAVAATAPAGTATAMPAQPKEAAKPIEAVTKPAEQPKPPQPATATGQPQLPDVAGVADRVRPAVAFIAVRATGAQGAFGGVQPRQGVGSGAIFDPQGFIFTNNHVV